MIDADTVRLTSVGTHSIGGSRNPSTQFCCLAYPETQWCVSSQLASQSSGHINLFSETLAMSKACYRIVREIMCFHICSV